LSRKGVPTSDGDVEQRFHFLKDPAFVDAVFLQNPERIEALGYVMLMMLLGLFFLPYMLQDVREIRTDQAMRQYLGGTKKWRPFHFLRPILAQGLLTSDYIAEALWSRGWRPKGIPVTPRLRSVDVLIGLAWILILVMEVARWPNWH
jgi:hypothetical protein